MTKWRGREASSLDDCHHVLDRDASIATSPTFMSIEPWNGGCSSRADELSLPEETMAHGSHALCRRAPFVSRSRADLSKPVLVARVQRAALSPRRKGPL